MRLTRAEIEELLKLLSVADAEYVAGYGGKLKTLGSAEQKLREQSQKQKRKKEQP